MSPISLVVQPEVINIEPFCSPERLSCGLRQRQPVEEEKTAAAIGAGEYASRVDLIFLHVHDSQVGDQSGNVEPSPAVVGRTENSGARLPAIDRLGSKVNKVRVAPNIYFLTPYICPLWLKS